MKKLKFLAIIPARGGSKGIKKKNIVEVCGKSLIEYTIIPSLELVSHGVLDKCIISTDSDEIAEISKKIGAKVPFIRPENLSTDKAKSVDLILHSIDFYEKQGIYFDAVLLLQPTCPMKSKDDISNAIKIYTENHNDSLISVFREDYINNLVMYKKEGFLAQPLSAEHNQGVRRQDHGEHYVRNGAIYITDVEFLKKEKKIISDVPLMYEMPKERSINIDTQNDLDYLNWLLCK